MRVLLDTNVLVSAFVGSGVCAGVFEGCLEVHDLLTSEFLIEEFQRTLTAKFQYPSNTVQAAVGLLRREMILVQPVAVAQGAVRDPDDLAVLGTALAGQCRCIVTGDDDLLALGRFRGIDIIRPADFGRFEAEHPE